MKADTHPGPRARETTNGSSLFLLQQLMVGRAEGAQDPMRTAQVCGGEGGAQRPADCQGWSPESDPLSALAAASVKWGEMTATS